MQIFVATVPRNPVNSDSLHSVDLVELDSFTKNSIVQFHGLQLVCANVREEETIFGVIYK